MRPFRLLLVLTFFGVPVWAEPVAQEASIEAAAPPVEGGAAPGPEQAGTQEEAAEAALAPADAPVPEDAAAIDEAPVEEEAPDVEAAPEVQAPQVADEAPPPVGPTPAARPARRLRAAPVQPAVEDAVVEPVSSPPPRRWEGEPMNELALVAGWNAPSGWGGRYLRRIPDTPLAVGAGLAPLTLWGIKLSLIVRRAPRFEHGFFQQVSVGFSTGVDEVTEVLVDEAGARNISLRKTPGRTLDLVFGYRWAAFTRSFAELFTGWSFNFQGTYLQNAEVSKVPLPQSLREELDVSTPGGLILGVTFGWRF